MGPSAAIEVLREAAMDGADHLYLISDDVYAGSDTLATSRVIASALDYIERPPLVLCGRRAIDGETGQVGPETSVLLGYHCVTNVISIEEVNTGQVTVKRLLETKIQTLSVPLPAVICVCETNILSQLPSLNNIRRAATMPIQVLSNNELKIQPEQCGAGGSPTRVMRIHRKSMERRKAQYADQEEGIRILETLLEKR